ncbi:MAG: type VI secretion system ImpA family N-terminal domain-containing protein [Pseudomonadota bacterium]
MRYSWLLEDTAEEPPCGPDLEQTDPEYFNHLLTAESLLPDSFFKFDRATIDLREQTKILADYLKQCRDIRLLCLEAKFRILFGQPAEFFECLIGIENLLQTHWDAVYPRGEGEDFMMRSAAISTIEDLKTVILPLEYAPLVTDRRHGPITYRAQRVALGDVAIREGENELDSGTIVETLAAEDHREASEKLYALGVQAKQSLDAIRSVFIDKSGYEFAPTFDGVAAVIDGINGLIAEARPDLARSDDGEDDVDAAEGGDADGSDGADGMAGAAAGGEDGDTRVVSQTIVVAGVEISGRGPARQALQSASQYFADNEPSNPALILVHQAQSLVGKSFVDAMQILVPSSVDTARLKVLADKDLELSIDQMRSLSSEALQNQQVEASDGGTEETSGNAFQATNRAEAVALIKGVDQFYRANEPSSPIPMLLGKARKYLNMDFEIILSDLLPKREPEDDNG